MPHVNRRTLETGHDGLVENLLTYLRTLPQSKWVKIVGGPMQEAGISDIIGCLRGYFVSIEVKLPGEYPRDIQALHLKEFTEAQAITGVAHSLEECQAIIALVPKQVMRISYLENEAIDF